ncbi:MAG: molybdopterin biosynthesis protein [Desulfobacterales bacterium]|nr:molybdopterin biosynthesis protein [Desulfobacterales bacterium]
MGRNVYLKMKRLEEARRIVLDELGALPALAVETVPVPDAVGRVLAEPVHAAISAPNYHAAAMDGVAVRAETTYGASESRPRELSLGREAYFVNTGNVLPAGTDAVIMIEAVQLPGDERVRIEAPAFPWQHVRRIGEDIVATELLFPRHHRVTPICLGALLTAGIFSVPVKCKPRVLIIPTGSELVDWRRTPLSDLKPGQVLETNSFVLGALVEACGGVFTRHPMVADEIPRIRAALDAARQEGYQIALVLGGSSAGSEDYARAVIAALGEVFVHGVTIMPGKPVVIGRVGPMAAFGIPGYPVSAVIVFEQLVKPLIAALLAQTPPPPPTALVEPTRKIASKLGVEEFVRVKLGRVGTRIVATPLPRGAGQITSLTKADGIIRVPVDTEGLRENEPVAAELMRPPEELDRTIVVVGSHDNTLDVLADQLKAARGDLGLSSSHVGSMGGLMAIKRGGCHLAGCHLLDPEDGSYNLTYIRKHLPGRAVTLVTLVLRENGLIVPRGNPKAVRGIEDLVRPDLTFINRQAGSGTRLLLDYRLKELGLDPSEIRGYGVEEFTHMAVAVAVMTGSADTGLGIYAAAKALGLDFIPVVTEQYDLVIPEEHFGSANIRALLEVIVSAEFRRRVESLGGYSTRLTGKTIAVPGN